MEGIQQEYVLVKLSARKFIVVSITSNIRVLLGTTLEHAHDGSIKYGPANYNDARSWLIEQCKVSPRIRCNQCEALMINGLFCHETGCPNTNSRYDINSGEWIKQRKCFDCGYMCDADSECCSKDED